MFTARHVQEMTHTAAKQAAIQMKTNALKKTWELDGLPSHRNINDHPHTVMYELYSDSSKIWPFWGKLTKTPFYGRSNLLGGGYGRRMKNTSISNDMPLNFPNAERHPTVVAMNIKLADTALAEAEAKLEALHQPHIKGAKKDLKESAYVLPGGMSTLANKPAHNARYKTYAYVGRHNQRMTLLEPLITERKQSPIVWRDPRPADLDFTEVLNSHHKDLGQGHQISLGQGESTSIRGSARGDRHTTGPLSVRTKGLK